jgi:hypothetical protein
MLNKCLAFASSNLTQSAPWTRRGFRAIETQVLMQNSNSEAHPIIASVRAQIARPHLKMNKMPIPLKFENLCSFSICDILHDSTQAAVKRTSDVTLADCAWNWPSPIVVNDFSIPAFLINSIRNFSRFHGPQAN